MKYFLSGIFLIAVIDARAQDSLSTAMLTPGSIIKVSPLHLANFYPTIEIAYEQPLMKKVSLQTEVGYVLNYKQNSDHDFQNKRGIKGKVEGRYYLWTNPRHTIFYYTALEAYINAIHFDRQQTRFECFDTNCSSTYTQTYTGTGKYQEHGVSFKFGFQWMIHRFSIDLNSGWTIRSIRYTVPQFPGRILDEGVDFGFIQIPNEETRVTFGPNLGIRVGYRLR